MQCNTAYCNFSGVFILLNYPSGHLHLKEAFCVGWEARSRQGATVRRQEDHRCSAVGTVALVTPAFWKYPVSQTEWLEETSLGLGRKRVLFISSQQKLTDQKKTTFCPNVHVEPLTWYNLLFSENEKIISIFWLHVDSGHSSVV